MCSIIIPKSVGCLYRAIWCESFGFVGAPFFVCVAIVADVGADVIATRISNNLS